MVLTVKPNHFIYITNRLDDLKKKNQHGVVENSAERFVSSRNSTNNCIFSPERWVYRSALLLASRSSHSERGLRCHQSFFTLERELFMLEQYEHNIHSPSLALDQIIVRYCTRLERWVFQMNAQHFLITDAFMELYLSSKSSLVYLKLNFLDLKENNSYRDPKLIRPFFLFFFSFSF